MNDRITCRKIGGGTVEVPREEMTFRPSAYGIITRGERILLIRQPDGRLFFPGGGMEIDETVPETVVREVREETGQEVTVGALACFHEECLFYTPETVAWHSLCFFHYCELVSDPTTEMRGVDEELEGRPEWVEIAGLRPEQFIKLGAAAFRRIRGDI